MGKHAFRSWFFVLRSSFFGHLAKNQAQRTKNVLLLLCALCISMVSVSALVTRAQDTNVYSYSPWTTNQDGFVWAYDTNLPTVPSMYLPATNGWYLGGHVGNYECSWLSSGWTTNDWVLNSSTSTSTNQAQAKTRSLPTAVVLVDTSDVTDPTAYRPAVVGQMLLGQQSGSLTSLWMAVSLDPASGWLLLKAWSP